MINVLIPSCGQSEFFNDSYYPKTLYEVKGKPMIQQVVDNYRNLLDKHFVFLFLQEECNRFHTDNVASLMVKENSDIIRLKGVTKGALCSCLMAIKYIDNNDELIITNNDQVLDVDFNKVIGLFREKEMDCGVICFNSLHPRLSYIRTGDLEKELVIEAVEKRPISHQAIAGFYYFRKGCEFIQCAKSAIYKGSVCEGKYYLTSAINEMILLDKKIGYFDVENSQYHSFYTPDKVRAYENGFDNRY